MTPERLKVWTVILGLFSKVWPFFVPGAAIAEAWEFSLEDLTDDELAHAARHVMASQSNQPTPADLHDAALGKLQWIDVWKRDAWGSVVLQRGAPVSVGRKQVRVKPGQPVPILLSWGKPDDEFANGIEPAKEPELLPHPSVAGLIGGLAWKMVPAQKKARSS